LLVTITGTARIPQRNLRRHERVGREHRYRLHPENLDEVRQWLRQLGLAGGTALVGLGGHTDTDT
jgi:hypothetical protein